jgi:signal transduction histidine kinase
MRAPAQLRSTARSRSWTESERVCISFYAQVHPDDLPGCLRALQLHLNGATDFYENVHRIKHISGEWRHVIDRGRIMERDADGNATLIAGTYTDVTVLKVAEERARTALRDAEERQQARNRFLAAMSHEIRTPLTGMVRSLATVVAVHASLVRRAPRLVWASLSVARRCMPAERP